LDGSVRDFQKHSVTAGKNFPATGPLGPWLVTADDIPDPQRLRLTTRLNGAVVQNDTTDHMIFDVATIIEYLSTVTWLEPGDVIATGTPDGVGAGRKPPLWMKAGDKVEVEVSGIGVLGVNVVDE
ncbi:MAG: fumarylacetoacetate hydrolase family protein, partial [Reyranella sp.]|nr:fumarylacetoacetate hydrolase family protein [Reyranella sp.]